MADIRVKLEVNSDSETEFLGDVSISDSSKNSNVGLQVNSNNIYDKVPNTVKTDIEGISWANGYLSFNQKGMLANIDTKTGNLLSEKEPLGFVFGVTDSEGNYDVTLTFKNASNLDKIVIIGNKVANQFPIEARLDGSVISIYSDDNNWAIKFNSASDNHTIRFIKWNRPNYNACISAIRVMLKYFEITKFNGLKSVESTSQITNDSNEISYGILPNSGSVEISDTMGEIKDLINDGIINASNCNLIIDFNNNNVQEHLISDSDYLSNSVTVSFNCSNILESWNGKKYDKYKISFNITNLYLLLKSCLYMIGYNDSDIDLMLSDKIVSGYNNITQSVKDYLKSINSTAFLVDQSSNVYDVINNICTLAQLRVVADNSGNIKFLSARPIEIYEKKANVIVVPSKNQKTQFSEDVIIRNKKNKVLIQEYEINAEELIDDYTELKELNENSKSVFVYTDEINPSNEDNWAKYNIEKITVGSNSWLVGFFDKNYIIETNYQKIVSLAEPFCILKIKMKMTEPEEIEEESAIGGELRGYDSFEDFISNIPTSGSSYHLGGYLKTKTSDIPEYNNIFSKNTRYFFAIPYAVFSTDQVNLFFQILYGMEAEGQNLVKLENVTTYGEGNNEYNVSTNNFFVTTAKIGSKKISEIFANNILNDYEKGTNSASISICCLNYYYENGQIAKDYSKGEIIDIGDVLRIDKDNYGTPLNNKYWKVIGRTFRYAGVPEEDLELESVEFKAFLPSQKYYISTELTNTSVKIERLSSMYYVDLGEIDTSTPVYEGDVLVFTLTPNEGKELSYATITSATSGKDTSYKSGEQYIVGKFDIVLKAFSASWETIITNKTVSALPYSSDEGGYVGTIQINGLKPNMRTRITGYVESRSNTLNGTGQISINNEIGVGADEFISFSQDLFDSVGEPVAFLEFKIKAPSQENVLEYSNYTSNLQGFFYTLSITKLEQFL